MRSHDVVARSKMTLLAAAELSGHETWQFVRGNAIECQGLSRYGVTD
jgi:hypothetical protein